MKALILVDLQNDFLPNGALGVADGDQIIPTINNIQKHFKIIVATRDWHPMNHGSFASNHEGKKPGDVVELHGLQQVLWNDHCVQGSPGAELSPLLNQALINYVVFKGTNPEIDSYSAFFDNGRLKQTGLDSYLKRNKVSSIYIAGLTTDYCVYFTVKDGLSLGYEAYLITDAIKGVNLQPNDAENAIKDMVQKGTNLITSEEILKWKSKIHK